MRHKNVSTASVIIACIEILLELIAVLFVTTKLVRGGQLRLLPFYVKMIVGFYIVFVLFMTLTAGTLAVVLHEWEHIESK